MTTTDDTLATTFEPMACMDCISEGKTPEQCATTIHPERALRLIGRSFPAPAPEPELVPA